MGDYKGCPAFEQLTQTFLQGDLRLRIDAGSSFVQNQNPWVRQQGSGKRNQLPLSD